MPICSDVTGTPRYACARIDLESALSALIASQLPIKAWHAYLNDPTEANAILDRVVHSSHEIELKGTRSMRDGCAAAATSTGCHQRARTGEGVSG